MKKIILFGLIFLISCASVPKATKEVPETYQRFEKWSDKDKEKFKEFQAKILETHSEWKDSLFRSKATSLRLKSNKKRKEVLRHYIEFLRELDIYLSLKNEPQERKKLDQEIRQDELKLNKSSLKIEYLTRKQKEEEVYTELKEAEFLYLKAEMEYEKAKIASKNQKEEGISSKSPDYVDLDEYEDQYAKFKEDKLKKNTHYESAKKYTQELNYEKEKDEPEHLELSPSLDHPSL